MKVFTLEALRSRLFIRIDKMKAARRTEEEIDWEQYALDVIDDRIRAKKEMEKKANE